MEHPYMHEDFLKFESKVNQVAKLLEELNSSTKTEDPQSSTDIRKQIKNMTDNVGEDDFIVTVRHDRTVINDMPIDQQKDEDKTGPAMMDKFSFMRQMEEDANERARVRKQREETAERFRKLGNDAFRNGKYEAAINFYTKAIAHVKDSPVLYNNRALCYLRLKNYKRAIMDTDNVITHLDEKNLQSWLYRAAAYRRMGDEKNYEKSIDLARKNNTKQMEQIDNFIQKLANGLI